MSGLYLLSNVVTVFWARMRKHIRWIHGNTRLRTAGCGGSLATIAKRPQKITFAEMREMGLRGLLIYCADYRCSLT